MSEETRNIESILSNMIDAVPKSEKKLRDGLVEILSEAKEKTGDEYVKVHMTKLQNLMKQLGIKPPKQDWEWSMFEALTGKPKEDLEPIYAAREKRRQG